MRFAHLQGELRACPLIQGTSQRCSSSKLRLNRSLLVVVVDSTPLLNCSNSQCRRLPQPPQHDQGKYKQCKPFIAFLAPVRLARDRTLVAQDSPKKHTRLQIAAARHTKQAMKLLHPKRPLTTRFPKDDANEIKTQCRLLNTPRKMPQQASQSPPARHDQTRRDVALDSHGKYIKTTRSKCGP